MNIALVSLNQKWEDKAHNLTAAEGYVCLAAEQGCDLVVFPEMTLTGFSMDTAAIGEDEASSTTVSEFSGLASQYGIAVIFGVVFLKGDKATNNLIYADADGGMVTYSKMHPFSFAGEERYYEGGDTVVTTEICGVPAGFSVCYDLRFPELYSALARTGLMAFNIANWPNKRKEHWYALLQARAIEQQIYMIGVNRTGSDGNGLEYDRSSCIFDANGERLVPVSQEGEMDVFEVDIEALVRFREGFSTRQDRKRELYKQII